MENEDDVSHEISPFSCLSDEVLLIIFSYLTLEDVMNVAQICKKFNILLCDHKIVKRINLECAYSLSLCDLNRFFEPNVRCENVKSLSLASVYWLTSGELFGIVSRLKSLDCLLIHDTQLGINHLTDILDICKLIRRLSWTVLLPGKDKEIKYVKELASRMSLLQSLYLFLKSCDTSVLSLLLKNCVSLEELRMSNIMISSRANRGRLSGPRSLSSVTMPNLHSLVFTKSKRCKGSMIDFKTLYSRYFSDVSVWRMLWEDQQVIPFGNVEAEVLTSKLQNAEALSISLSNIPQEVVNLIMSKKSLKWLKIVESDISVEDANTNVIDPSITHLEWNYFPFPASLPVHLEHFCCRCWTSDAPSYTGNHMIVNPLLHLKRLSVACCFFLRNQGDSCCHKPNQSSGSSSSRKEPSSCTSCLEDCILKDFVESAPNVSELEIKCDELCRLVTYPNELGSLLHICNWHQLESLYLESIMLLDFSALPEIAQNCPRLRRFGLINVGSLESLAFKSDLIKALGFLKNLEDFRLGHPNCGDLTTIIEALSECSSLRRIAFTSKYTTVAVKLTILLSLVERCEQLIFLLVHLSCITRKMEKDFQRELKLRFSKRPALWAYIEGGEGDPQYPHLCPDVHYHQMIEDPACLSLQPPPFPF